MTMKTPLWLAVTISLAAIAFGAAQNDDAAKAEKIVNTTCTSCHDIRKIQTQALDAEAWKGVVETMIAKGAMVEKNEIPLLVSYLEDNFGPMPEGNGKELVLQKCTVCHDLKRVRQHFASPEEWADLLGAMENEGLKLSQEEFATVLRYLARNFRQ
jgi:mono/diheme cytochrome c family protein